ncbi:class I SAM-dependent methyltransferase [Sporolactobacillus spathodeae]|uniref:2-polyprenyl-3-methyl-5-hydroxy-6-metoxy-1, 4-benzoquinol methylase n=1 Tax=Sporolactobacillus spathodeae TaxID=1465502 RepID=A0ABS2Q830_9BACL|nr:methyltransferase domain-containing protein [Sporolactobacillus spathodeae]MBM7657949.1 2-polyprenyl-3-methyl-5-hydroxy-6-metoxy-1,4-benzoquinol methylase [Sporolactobacillus spathodeae]
MQDDQRLTSLFQILALLNAHQISYTIEGAMALALQGVPSVENEEEACRILFQWDAFEKISQLFADYPDFCIIDETDGKAITLAYDRWSYYLHCTYGTVIRTDPDRVLTPCQGNEIPVKCFDSYLRELNINSPMRRAVKEYLAQLQQTDASANGEAWNEDAFQAWIHRFGTPQQAAEKIRKNPKAKLGTLAPYFSENEVIGRRILNMLGSHGGKAIALASMGAEVTVVDISSENAAYARQTAAAIEVPLHYVVSDVLNLPEEEKAKSYDCVFMELGILHYFIDLEPLAALIMGMLRTGGTMILQDFHPVSTKLVTTKGKKQVVFGNYFDKKLITRSVAYEKHLDQDRHQQLKHHVYLREWTLGEIVTAFAAAGLRVERLDEAPNMKIADIGLPKLFTLVCTKD